MPRKKKSDNPNDVPDIENLIKLIAKTLKENMGDADIKNMANIANEFGIDIKLSGVSTKLSKNPNPKESRPTPPQLPPQMPLMQQPPEPFIETIYKKDSVIIDASIPNAKKEEIDVIASQGSLIIEVSNGHMVFSKKLQLEANVDPEKAVATYKNGVLEIALPIVQIAYQKDFKLSIS